MTFTYCIDHLVYRKEVHVSYHVQHSRCRLKPVSLMYRQMDGRIAIGTFPGVIILDCKPKLFYYHGSEETVIPVVTLPPVTNVY